MHKNILFLSLACAAGLNAQIDPGLRKGPSSTGSPLRGLSASELAFFEKGKVAFDEIDGVAEGLGPRFNLDGCGGCHSQPRLGGTSPPINPQFAVATKMGGLNRIPSFLKDNGPALVARRRRNPDGSPDGGVHNLFVITGRTDAPANCRVQQPDFSNMNNFSLRIPTPTFGLGLVESIRDSALRANLTANGDRRRLLGIGGRFNTNGSDGTITRFGWKAQNKSLGIFAGEAYNVEVGVTNDLFPQDREEDPACNQTGGPESASDLETGEKSDLELFTYFMRFLAPPQPAPASPSSDLGRAVFESTGCAMCHTPTLKSGASAFAALSNKDVPLYSDLALHRMGQGLADGINQGSALGDEFRTAPLWGLGERIFFLHDGRSRDLVETIRMHDSPGSEAHQVIRLFEALSPDQKRDLLVFLRSL